MQALFLELLDFHIHINEVLRINAFLFFDCYLRLQVFFLFHVIFRMLCLHYTIFVLLSFGFSLSYSGYVLTFFLTFFSVRIFARFIQTQRYRDIRLFIIAL